jgi:uncharacterized protein (TIGR03437 family)
LWYISPEQINFELPSELPFGNATAVVTYGSASSPAFQFTVGQATPGIFTYGSNRAIATDSFGSLIDAQHPTQSGAAITVYLTGLGPLDHPVATNATSPYDPLAHATLPASASIGNVVTPIQFLGLTPGGIALGQANLTVPDLVPGDYAISISIGGTASNAAIISVGPSR